MDMFWTVLGYIGLIMGAIIYLVMAGFVTWGSYENAIEYAEFRDKALSNAERFKGQITPELPLTSPTRIRLQTRVDDNLHAAKKNHYQARMSQITMWTALLWPLWLVFYALVWFVIAARKVHKAVKGEVKR